LIHPIDPGTFQRQHWEQRHLHVIRNDPDYYRDLLTLDGIDQALSLSGTDLEHLRVVVDGKETPVSALTTLGGPAGHANALEALYERYRTGSTIVVNSLEQRFEPMRRWVQALGAEIGCRIQMNVYLTPAGARGFAPHYDSHDVFIAQVYGAKHWRLSAPPIELPLHTQPYDKSQPEPDADEEFDLRAGDVLYLPRGTVHSGTSSETASLHVTIGVHPMLYSTALENAFRRLCHEDARFRRGFPVGFTTDEKRRQEAVDTLTELLAAMAERLAPEEIVNDPVVWAASANPPALRHHLVDLERLGEVGIGTPMRRRPGLHWNLTVAEDDIRLDFHNKTVRLPVLVADEVRYAVERGDWFTASAIPGDLDEPGRMVLVDTLLREGFLTLH
jgi:ribosomal protein L16 Arg81 hydroxylase